jgi:hypothetical protein
MAEKPELAKGEIRFKQIAVGVGEHGQEISQAHLYGLTEDGLVYRWHSGWKMWVPMPMSFTEER